MNLLTSCYKYHLIDLFDIVQKCLDEVIFLYTQFYTKDRLSGSKNFLVIEKLYRVSKKKFKLFAGYVYKKGM